MKTNPQTILNQKIARQLHAYSTATKEIEAIESAEYLQKQYLRQAQAFHALQLLAHYHYKHLFNTTKIKRLTHASGEATLGFQTLSPALTKPNRLPWEQVAQKLYHIDPALVTMQPNKAAILALNDQDSRYKPVQDLGVVPIQDESFFVNIL